MTRQTPTRLCLGLLTSLFLLAACATAPAAGGQGADTTPTSVDSDH